LLKENTNDDGRIRLWTSQSKIVLDTINKTGVYHVKKEYIIQKYQEASKVFLESYNWFISKGVNIVPRPDGSEYPIWLFTDVRYVDNHHDSILLELLVDKRDVILFDMEKWNRILNLSYIPKDREDAKDYEDLLAKQGIKDETDIYMKAYYPYLKQKVVKSWDRLFNFDLSSESKQAALWEIRKEWIVNTDVF